MIEYRTSITRIMLRSERDKLFVFGDNMVRRGHGGQAQAMRGEPNAVGIPTKRLPMMTNGAFLTDEDFDEWVNETRKDIERLVNHRGTVVWPGMGLGIGRARLAEHSPKIYRAVGFVRAVLKHDTCGICERRHHLLEACRSAYFWE